MAQKNNKIVFLGDTHFGLRKGNDDHHEHMALFFKDFFEYIDQNVIKTIVQVGDIFDVRKNVDIKVIDYFRNVFLNEITKRKLQLYIVVGNHDIYYRESVKINTVSAILHDYRLMNPDIITIIDSPTDVTIEGQKFFMVPWICKENIDEVNTALRKSKAKYCVGHFEFNGFEMNKGHQMTTKFDHKEYSKFDLVISGHYHMKSRKDNVLYTGTPYQITWMDYEDEKGFWVMDDGDMLFVPNRHTIYNKIWYNDGFAPSKNEVYRKYIQLIVTERIEAKELASLIDAIQLMEPLDVKVIERYSEHLSQETYVHDILQTDQLLKEYVDNSQIDLDKPRMSALLLDLYRKALASE